MGYAPKLQGKVPAIKGGRGAGKASKVKAIGVGKRGSIIISKELVEGLGIGAEDKFTVRKTKAGIALKKADINFSAQQSCWYIRVAQRNLKLYFRICL
jgi:hypothetical protein